MLGSKPCQLIVAGPMSLLTRSSHPRLGEGIPVDGVMLEGGGAVDESMVTGESMPVGKQPGDKVTNGTGSLVMCADNAGSDTVLSRIVAMVAEAQRSRAPIQRMA